MAKKIYHISLISIKQLMKTNKAVLNKGFKDYQLLEYNKRFGKSYFDSQIEKFICYMHLQNNIPYSLSAIKHFSSNSFLENIFNLLDFKQFNFVDKVSQRDFFYHFCFIAKNNNQAVLDTFLQKIFMHFYPAFTRSSNVKINFVNMAQDLIKFRKLDIKESFGEKDKGVFYKIWINDKIVVDDSGKSIKTLRKNGYKKVLYTLIDNEI